MNDKVVPASFSHVPFLSEAARQVDMDECWQMGVIPFRTALEVSLQTSGVAKTWVVNDMPAAIGGIRPIENDEIREGCIWLLGTTLIDSYPRRFSTRALVEFERAQQDYDLLWNYISVQNTKYIRWLRWAGFDFSEPIPYGFFRKPFHRFEWRRYQ